MMEFMQFWFVFGIALVIQDCVCGTRETITSRSHENIIMHSTQTAIATSSNSIEFLNGSTVAVQITYTGRIYDYSSSTVSVHVNGTNTGIFFQIHSISFLLPNATEEYSNIYTWRYQTGTVLDTWVLYVIDNPEGLELLADTSVYINSFPHLSDTIITRMNAKVTWFFNEQLLYSPYFYIYIHPGLDNTTVQYQIQDMWGHKTNITSVIRVAKDREDDREFHRLQQFVYVLCGLLAGTILALIAMWIHYGRRHSMCYTQLASQETSANKRNLLGVRRQKSLRIENVNRTTNSTNVRNIQEIRMNDTDKNTAEKEPLLNRHAGYIDMSGTATANSEDVYEHVN